MAPANNLFAIRSMVGTTNQAACQLAANVFGRDEQSKLEFSGAYRGCSQAFVLIVLASASTAALRVYRGKHL